MAFNQFPYCNFHELNLDWILNKIHELESAWSTYQVLNHITFRGDWVITAQYPAYSVVKNGNNGYLSLKPVPSGIDISNNDYWVEVYDYDQLAAELNQRVGDLEQQTGDMEQQINAIETELKNYVASETTKVMTYDKPLQREKFKAGVLPIIADYLERAYGGHCLTNPNTAASKVVFIYDNRKTYAGWLGRPTGANTYVGTDTREFNGVSYPVMYLDCSTFVNLLTCGRNYQHSLNYFTTNENGNTDVDYPGADFRNLIWLCSELYATNDDWWQFDWNSNLLVGNMLRIMDSCGNAGVQIQKIINGVKTKDSAAIANLQTGDVLFGGQTNSKNYKTVVHCAMFVKTLAELDEVSPGRGFKTYNSATDAEGYIVEVGSAKGGIDYQDVLRITTLNEFLTTFDDAYAVFPMSTVETSSRKKMYYDRKFTCWRFEAFYAPMFNYIDSIRFFSPSVVKNYATRTANLALKNGADLNTLFDDWVASASNAIAASLINKPAEVTSGCVVLKTIAPSWMGLYRLQELYNFPLAGTTGAINVYRRYCTYDGNWSEWVKV